MATYNGFEEWLNHAIVELKDTHDFQQPLIEALKKKINNQNFKHGVKSLKKRTIAKKRRRGFSSPTSRLKGSGDLVNSISVLEDQYALCEIGFPDNKLHKESKLSMQTLAFYHLNGKGNLPKNQDFVWLDDSEIQELEKIFASKFD